MQAERVADSVTALRLVRSDRTQVSCLLHAFVLPKTQYVAHFFFFGPQVGQGVRGRRDFAGNLGDNFDASSGQGVHLAEIVVVGEAGPPRRVTRRRRGQ